MENEFRFWIDYNTVGFTRWQKHQFKMELAKKLHLTEDILGNWYRGTFVPDMLRKYAINDILEEKVFKIE